jgi:DNA invertase Pin-like site-specific DNA recombinase
VLLDGYVRVSQVGGRSGERFISPSVQREQIEAWARVHGATIVEIYEELDESGGRGDRPLLLRVLERIETGETQGVVVSHLDRWGRSLLDGLKSIERIQAAGGTFVSVQDGFDLGTPTGTFVLRVLLSVAQMERERIGEAFNAARERAISRGVCMTPAPVGYQRTGDGRLKVDPDAGPLIQEVFRRRAEGARWRDLCRFLEQAGLQTGRGNRFWTENTVRCLMRNRTYLGEVRHGQYVNRNAHEPLTDAPTFAAAQLPRRMIGNNHSTPLAGLMRCAGCCMAMSLRSAGPTGHWQRSYRCLGKSSKGHCPAPAVIRASELEPLLEDHFFRLLKRRRRDGQTTKRLADTEDKVAQAETDVAAYRDNLRLQHTLGEERFVAGLEHRARVLERALLELAAARRAAETSGVCDPSELQTRWPQLSVDERRELIGRVIDCLFIGGRTGPVTERVYVCLRGEEPVDLPRRGGRHHKLRSFDWPKRLRAANRLREPRPWSERRIRQELSMYMEGRDGWSTYDAFQVAGHARLWHQVMRYGGPGFWSKELGIEISARYLMPRWNRERLRAALTPFLRRFDHWPLQTEWDAAGLSALRKAVRYHGGTKYWAAEFGLPRRDRRQGPLPYWTEERIEAQLIELTKGASTYPTAAQFTESGLRGLYTLIDKKWGHNHWAHRLSLPRVRSRRSARSSMPAASRDN